MSVGGGGGRADGSPSSCPGSMRKGLLPPVASSLPHRHSQRHHHTLQEAVSLAMYAAMYAEASVRECGRYYACESVSASVTTTVMVAGRGSVMVAWCLRQRQSQCDHHSHQEGQSQCHHHRHHH